MKFIKKHISTIVAILIFILVLIGLLILKGIFFPEENKAIYGNRLEGRENVTITNKTKSAIKDKLGEGGHQVDIRIAGRIIEINLKVTEGTNVEDAKKIANKSLECLSDKEKEYYDIQVFVENDKNTTQFPIIGYKHHSKTAFSWTKNR